MKLILLVLFMLGAGACGARSSSPGRAQRVALPNSHLQTSSASSAHLISPSATPKGLLEVVATAEGELWLGADTTVTNAILLGGCFVDHRLDHAVAWGRVNSQPFPDSSIFEPDGFPTYLGRWPGDLWALQAFQSCDGPVNCVGSRIYATKNGRWELLHRDAEHAFLDVWEAPRDCWLGLRSDADVTRQVSTMLQRITLRCPTRLPELFVYRTSTVFIAPRGLPDGGIAAIEQDSDQWLFNPSRTQTPSRLVVWDTNGKERTFDLPAPESARKSKLSSRLRILRANEGELIVFGSLFKDPRDKQAPDLEGLDATYAVRCNASGCLPLPLPVLAKALAFQVAEDGTLLLAGRETETWSLWALPLNGTWQKLGVATKEWGSARIGSLYGSSIDDVWVTAETAVKPVRAALLRNAR